MAFEGDGLSLMPEADGPLDAARPEVVIDPAAPEMRSILDDLVAEVRREHERAAFRESVIDRLHEENQRLRRGELEALLAPVRNGLFRVHDMARKAARQVSSTSDNAAQLLDAVADECVDILTGVGVERFEAVVGERYDPARHRPVASARAEEALQDNTIAQSRTAGFATDQRVIRRADVVVARYEAPEGEGHR
ncbi:MAG TPA: nucleotide exchange factor GrpE [Candidatus Limnocylindrales bacterium]|nr:nucleotide exchange factor GrpE [Candidatus Limnocylindrales bacterium]